MNLVARHRYTVNEGTKFTRVYDFYTLDVTPYRMALSIILVTADTVELAAIRRQLEMVDHAEPVRAAAALPG